MTNHSIPEKARKANTWTQTNKINYPFILTEDTLVLVVKMIQMRWSVCQPFIQHPVPNIHSKHHRRKYALVGSSEFLIKKYDPQTQCWCTHFFPWAKMTYMYKVIHVWDVHILNSSTELSSEKNKSAINRMQPKTVLWWNGISHCLCLSTVWNLCSMKMQKKNTTWA